MSRSFVLVGLGAANLAGLALAGYAEFGTHPNLVSTTTQLKNFRVTREFSQSKILRRSSLRRVLIQCEKPKQPYPLTDIPPGEVMVSDETGSRACSAGVFRHLSGSSSISHGILRQVAAEERDAALSQFLERHR